MYHIMQDSEGHAKEFGFTLNSKGNERGFYWVGVEWVKWGVI